MKYLVSLLGFVFAAQQAQGQTATVDSFLSSAWNSQAMRLQQKNLDLYGESKFVNPIDGLQLRLEQKDDLKIQTGVRLTPKGFTEYRILQDLHDQEARLENMEYKSQLTSALETRYLAILDYIDAQEKQKRLAELLDIIRKSLRMTQAATRSSNADALQLLKVREEFEEAQFKMSQVQTRIRNVLTHLKALDINLPKDPQLLVTLPKPKDLLSHLDKLTEKKSIPEKTLSVRMAEEKALKARNSLAMDMSRDSKLIDFVEVGIVDDSKQKERKYTLEVSINIPGFTATSFSQREKARELVQYELDILESRKLQTSELEGLRQDVEQAAKLYENLYGSDFVAAETKIKNLARQQNPILTVNLEKTSIERAFRAQEVAYLAGKSYLSYLAKADILSEQPEINFLSKDLSRIKR